METFKAILLGTILWVLGASIYSASFFIPILPDLELQANLILAIMMIPNAWLGTRIYYSNGSSMHGFKLATLILCIAILLDALITVPYIIPNGSSYSDFFGAIEFWLIATEYFLVVYSYWHFRVINKSQIAES